MSKLEELLKELCPDGVEYKMLKDISAMQRGTSVTKKNIVIGTVPVISGGKEPAYYCNKYNRDGETITIAGSGVGAGYVQYWDMPIFVCDAFSIKGNENFSTKYLFYCLANMQNYIYSTKKGGGVPHVHISSIDSIKIPIPPLPVQNEIVRILDNFTELTAELKTQLAAELTARKKQFGHYKDKILGIGCENESYFLENVCAIVDCPHTSPKWQSTGIPVIRNYNLVNGQIDTSNLSYVSEEEYRNRIKRITPQKNDILFSREAPIGNVGIIPEEFDCCQGQRVVLLRPNQQIVLPRYLLHVLQGPEVREQILRVGKMGATVSNFNISDLKRLKFKLPPIMVQKDVVGKLDMFDSLCSNISSGLPAEIEARTKQYEYYRDKLLTFPERA